MYNSAICCKYHQKHYFCFFHFRCATAAFTGVKVTRWAKNLYVCICIVHVRLSVCIKCILWSCNWVGRLLQVPQQQASEHARQELIRRTKHVSNANFIRPIAAAGCRGPGDRRTNGINSWDKVAERTADDDDERHSRLTTHDAMPIHCTLAIPNK